MVHPFVGTVKPEPTAGVIVTPVTTSGAVPLLVTVSGRFVVDPMARSPKARVVGTCTAGATWPWPVRLTDVGEPAAS